MTENNKLKLYQKIFNIQKKIGAIKKTSTNPFYNSKYFDINDLLKALRPLLIEQGLVITQPLTNNYGLLVLALTIWDIETGFELYTEGIILPNISDPQKMGSAITYYRRYALQAFFLLEAEDDDGNAAKIEKTEKTSKIENKQPQGQSVPGDNIRLKDGSLLRTGEKNGRKWYGHKKNGQMTFFDSKAEYDKVLLEEAVDPKVPNPPF